MVRGDARRDGLLAEARAAQCAHVSLRAIHKEFLSFQNNDVSYFSVWFREWALCASHVEHKELFEHKNPKDFTLRKAWLISDVGCRFSLSMAHLEGTGPMIQDDTRCVKDKSPPLSPLFILPCNSPLFFC